MMFGEKRIRELEGVVHKLRMDLADETAFRRAAMETPDKFADVKFCAECGVAFKPSVYAAMAQFITRFYPAATEAKPICTHCRPAHDDREKMARFAKENPDRVRAAYETYQAEQKEDES